MKLKVIELESHLHTTTFNKLTLPLTTTEVSQNRYHTRILNSKDCRKRKFNLIVNLETGRFLPLIGIAIGAVSLGSNRHSAANDSPPLRRFFVALLPRR